jgi:hypothetical protein
MFESMQVPLTENLLFYIESGVPEKLANANKGISNHAILMGVVLMVVGLLVEVFVFSQLRTVEEQMRKVLGLILHVDPAALTSTTRLVHVLAGQFSGTKSDAGGPNAEFCDAVLQQLPDAVMYAGDHTQKIQGANDSCVKLFGELALVGRNLSDVLTEERFEGIDLAKLIDEPTNELVLARADDGSEVFYDIASMVHGDRRIFVIADVTQTQRYNMLIDEERQRSDELLKSILPPSIVPRVQAGEQEISFAVQSASFSFMDVVEFTPWCSICCAMLIGGPRISKVGFAPPSTPATTGPPVLTPTRMRRCSLISSFNSPTRWMAERPKLHISFVCVTGSFVSAKMPPALT